MSNNFTKLNRDKERRKQKRLEMLGSNHPICIICGEDDWRCFEQHHIAGKAYGDELCTVCRNCHRKLSDEQYDHPKQIGKPPCNHEAIGHILLGLADLFILLAASFKKYGLFLIESARSNGNS